MARILIRTRGHDIINFVEKFDINREMFVIKVVEDWYGPLQWCKRPEMKMKGLDSSDSEDEEDTGSSPEEDVDHEEDIKSGEVSGDSAGEEEVAPELTVEDREDEEIQALSAAPSMQMSPCNSICPENEKTAPLECNEGTCSGSKEKTIMVNVGVSSYNNSGGVVDRSINVEGNSKKLYVTKGGGIKTVNKRLTFKCPNLLISIQKAMAVQISTITRPKTVLWPKCVTKITQWPRL